MAACGPAPASGPPPAATPTASTPAPPPTAVASTAPTPRGEDCKVPWLKTPLVRGDDAGLGPRDAPVVVLVFGGYRDRFTNKLGELLDELGRRGDVRVVFRHAPLEHHTRSEVAARFARAVLDLQGEKAFWTFHRRLTAKFDDEAAFGDDALTALAAESGADGGRVRALAESDATGRRVAEDEAVWKAFHAGGTPTILVNGALLVGAHAEAIKQAVAAALVDVRGREGDRASLSCRMTQAKLTEPPPAPALALPTPPDVDTWKVVLTGAPRVGGKEPLVTMVWFGDLADRFNKRVAPTIAKLRELYGDDLAVVWRHEPMPFHGQAAPRVHAAKIIRNKLGDAGFFQAIPLFLDLPEEDDAAPETVAKALNLEPAAVREGVSKRVAIGELDRDEVLGVRVKVAGTPQFFINGKRLAGAQPIAAFQSAIDAAKADAEARIKAGTPRAKVYESIVHDGRTETEPRLEKDPKTPAIPKDAPSRGPLSARVVLQVWGGFEDPFTAKLQKLIDELQLDHGPLRVVFRHRPLPSHKHATASAEAAVEAFAQQGSKGFFAMHDRLLAAQENLSFDALVQHATAIGLDVARFKTALEDHRHVKAIEADNAEAERIGIQGTPTIFVNGFRVEGSNRHAIRRAVRQVLGVKDPP